MQKQVLSPKGNSVWILYKDTVQLEFDKEKHWYFANGTYVPSVTGVTGFLDKSGPLTYWAAKQTVEYYRSKLVPGVVVDEVQLEAIHKEGLKYFRTKTEQAASIGSFVHSWIEEYVKRRMDSKLSDNMPEMPINERVKKGVEAFLAWEKDNKLQYVLSESKIYSKRYNYAGTCDLVAKVNNKLAVVDFKTGKGPYLDHFAQTAAYQNAIQEEYKWKIKTRWIVRVNKDTGDFHTYELPNSDYKDHKKLFLNLLSIYQIDKKLKKAQNKKE